MMQTDASELSSQQVSAIANDAAEQNGLALEGIPVYLPDQKEIQFVATGTPTAAPRVPSAFVGAIANILPGDQPKLALGPAAILLPVASGFITLIAGLLLVRWVVVDVVEIGTEFVDAGNEFLNSDAGQAIMLAVLGFLAVQLVRKVT